ncbi:MAG: hypothetical protein H8F28_05985 [Fibrella sp.]|nr:hypothetical protein [Armatimonadota bacterium]
MTEDESAVQWSVVVSDLADADIEEAFRYLAAFLEVKRVEDWVKGLYFAIFAVGGFPGPYANAVDEEPSKRRGHEVRHFLYRGPKKRPHSFVYKIFYRVLPLSASPKERSS